MKSAEKPNDRKNNILDQEKDIKEEEVRTSQKKTVVGPTGNQVLVPAEEIPETCKYESLHPEYVMYSFSCPHFVPFIYVA